MKKAFLVLAIVTTIASAQTNAVKDIVSLTTQERIDKLMRIASIYYQEGDLDNALNTFDRVLYIEPDHQEARYIMGVIYVSQKKYDEAINSINAWCNAFPDDFQGLNNLAWVYATAEDPSFRDSKKAIDLAQKALVMAPYDHHIWSTLAEAYYSGGEFKKAKRAIDHLVTLATKGGSKMTQTMVDGYNDQIQKYTRAMETEKMLKEN